MFSDKVSTLSSLEPDSLTVAKPSEIFVSDTPNGSFETTNTDAPLFDAACAACEPAPPDPITKTSYFFHYTFMINKDYLIF